MQPVRPEEMEKLLEKAKKELEEKLAQMTPEERAQAERKAQQRIQEDQAATQKLLDDAAGLLSASAPKAAPRFCGCCGAPAGGGKFCEYCGMPL